MASRYFLQLRQRSSSTPAIFLFSAILHYRTNLIVLYQRIRPQLHFSLPHSQNPNNNGETRYSPSHEKMMPACPTANERSHGETLVPADDSAPLRVSDDAPEISSPRSQSKQPRRSSPPPALLILSYIAVVCSFATTLPTVSCSATPSPDPPPKRVGMWSMPPGSTALVTGGTKGIGRAIVEELAGPAFGCRVLTCSRNGDELAERLEEWRGRGDSN